MRRHFVTLVAAGALYATAASPQAVAPSQPPVPVEADAPAGSSTPGSMAAGGAAAVVVVLGVLLISSLAFFPSN